MPEETKHHRITNKNYRQFLDEGIINTLSEEQINQALTNVKGKYKREGQNIIIVAYYTGARPNEYLRILAKDVTKEKNYILVKLPASKGGLPRTVYLPYKKPLAKEFYSYATGLFPDMPLFYHYQNKYVRTVQTKKGEKERISISDKLRYYFKIWFDNVIEEGVPPYYMRHNRFSKLSEAGATDEEMRQLKGCRTNESITPYKHMSTDKAKKIAKRLE